MGEAAPAQLSERERQVAERYVEGQSYKEIARELGISPATVRTHTNAVYRKLEVTSRIGLLHRLGVQAAPRPPTLALPDKPSLAVLPFDNLSGDPAQEYFADGMVEEITTALSKISGLFVIAHNSSFTYKGRAVDVKRVGRELGVRYLLEGSVRRAGHRVRITSQLVDAVGGSHLWADRFDWDLDDILELQDRVAEAVAGVIEPTLRRAEIDRAHRKPTESLDSYDLYLQALPLVLAMTPKANAQARKLLERALSLDPDYALASALKAYCHGRLYTRGWASADAEQEREAAISAARNALRTGENEPTALAIGGFAVEMVGWDFDAGMDALRRSIALHPNSALTLSFGSAVHCFGGDYAAALDHGRRALLLSPLDSLSYLPLTAIAYTHLFTGAPESALLHAGQAILARPEYFIAHNARVAALVELGRHDEARAAASHMKAAFPSAPILGATLRARDVQAFERFLAALRSAGLPG